MSAGGVAVTRVPVPGLRLFSVEDSQGSIRSPETQVGNHSLGAKIPVCVSEVLPEQNNVSARSFYTAHKCFLSTIAEWSRGDQDPTGLQSLKHLLWAPYRKSVLSPAPMYRTLSRVSYIAYYAQYKDCIVKTPKFKKV